MTDLPFAPLPSFMGVPFSRDPTNSRAAIVGVPFDCGTHPVRIGSRLGPAAIREQSSLVRRFEPPHADFDPIARLGLVDCGDAAVTPGAIVESHGVIEAAISHIVQAGAAPVALGGDGAISLPHLRALHRAYPDLAMLHIDAHTDTYPSHGTGERDRYNTATTFTRAVEESVLDPSCSYHVGPRGPVYMQGVFDFTRQKGYRLITGEDLFSRGFAPVLNELHEGLAGRPVFLCFDMDFFDPSCAPGVCTPTWGGASAREGLALIKGLAGLNFVGFEVNTVSPPHDVGGMTAFLAATVVHQFLLLACQAKR